MSMQSTSRTIEDLFGTRYYIDFYQRDYKWEREHVETLLDDVFFRFENDYDPAVDPTKETVSKYAWYYLSTYVTNTLNGRKFIVDGQQRLTTITLILIKLYHLAKEYGNEHHMDWLKQNIYGAHAEGRTYWMGTADRKHAIAGLFSGEAFPDDAESDDQDLTIRNICENYREISSYLDDELQTAHRAAAFTLYLMTRVELVELHIDDSRDVAMVFEVINDRGEKLQPYEVLKGELLGQLTKEEVNSTYYDIWTDSINPLQNRDRREPDNFFRLLFRSKHTDSRADYRDFDGDYQRVVFSRKWDPVLNLKRNPEGVKLLLQEDVAWYAPLYLRLLQIAKKGGMGNYAYFNVRLNRMDRQHLLVLSAIRVNDPEKDEKMRLVPRLFDRHYSLLQLNGCYDSNDFTESIIALNSAIRGASCQEIQAAFDEQLLKDIEKARGLAVDDPFQWTLFRNVGYELGSRFVRYFFARVEGFIAEEADRSRESFYNMARNSGYKNGHHVEHILANNEENRALFGDDQEVFIRERNRLGGLVLLKGRDNLSSSNEPYEHKLKTYSHGPSVTATLTPDFYHCNPGFADLMKKHDLDFHPIEVFDGDAVEDRHRLYFELAKIIWGDSSFPIE
jgi:hypothetical protein